MKKLMLIALIALMIMAAMPAQAMTITMSNPDSTAARDIMVYYPNSTLVGLYNTTSIITLDANYSYVFVMKPQGSSIIDDPTDWLTTVAFPYVRTHFVAIILIFAALAVLATRRR